MSGRVADTYDAFAKLEPAWEAIEKAGGVKTPFQSFAWIHHWLRHRKPGVRPFTLVLDDGATIAPFGIESVTGLRVLRFLGTGDSDYTGLVTTLPIDIAWNNVSLELARRRTAWDLIHLHSVRDRDVIVAALTRHIGSGFRERIYETCPWIQTDSSWEDLLAARKKMLYEVKRWARRLEVMGRLSLEVVVPPVQESILHDLLAVEQASWKWKWGSAAFQLGPQRDFLEAILRDSKMSLHLWLLRVSGQLIAFALVLIAQNRWYYYLPTFRQDYPNAGSYLLAQIVKESCASDCICLDLLRGHHHYKYAWTDVSNSVYEIIWWSDFRGRMAALGYALRWRAAEQPILHRLRSYLTRIGDRR